jgi:exodeoxyribonuclease VII large subunit
VTGAAPKIYTVAELVQRAHRCIESAFNGVHVEGEVTNLRVVSSGHAYFTLADGGALLPVAMWRSALARLRFRLQDGQRIRVFGRPGIYAAQGKFQLYAERAEPAGQGALLLQLEQLKARLAAEGLFARERKRPVPRWPRVIGVVTSPTGAAIHDILKVARRRCPSRILLAPAQVQGDGAAFTMIAALQRLQAVPGVDVIILGRGGGAAEDLWAFNDEGLARAVAACRVPVVSAVGHEVDVTICDFVADLRAATPSHAAELVVPDRDACNHRLHQLTRRLALVTQRRLLNERSRVERAGHRLHAVGRRLAYAPRRRLAALLARLDAQHPRQRLARDRRRLAALLARLGAQHPRHRLALARRRLAALAAALQAQHPRHRLALARRRLALAAAALRQRGPQLAQPARLRLARAAAALQALSPLAVLARGYAIASDAAGRPLRDAADIQPGDELHVRLHRGSLRAGVLERGED